jgi:hypothetical protein
MSDADDAQAGETITMLQCPVCGRGRQHKCELKGTAICRGCDEEFPVVDGRLRHIGATGAVQQLVDGPVVYDELPNVSLGNRSLIRRLKPAGGGAGLRASWDNRREACSIAYLDGDERRAVDLFIEENLEYVADCLSARHNNPLTQHWPDQMYDLLIEQYHWRQEGGGDAQ